MIKIPLLRSKLYALIDDNDIGLIKGHPWGIFRTIRGRLYAYDNHRLMHRVIMNPPKGLVVHHKNGDGLDNRRDNLEVTTYSINGQGNNKKLLSNNSSGTHGVDFLKSRGKWRARIKVDGEEVHLGLFNSKDAAIKRRKQAEIDFWG